jgi:hypothetical protein
MIGGIAMLPLESTLSAANAVKRIRYTHDAMIDVIIAHPEISGEELGRHFGYTGAWISRVTCSDAFNTRLAERRGEIVSPFLVATFEERLKGLANQSLDIVSEKLERGKDVDLAMRALELTTKSLGYGARQTNVAVQTSFVVAMPSKVECPQDWAKSYSNVVDIAGVEVEERAE